MMNNVKNIKIKTTCVKNRFNQNYSDTIVEIFIDDNLIHSISYSHNGFGYNIAFSNKRVDVSKDNIISSKTFSVNGILKIKKIINRKGEIGETVYILNDDLYDKISVVFLAYKFSGIDIGIWNINNRISPSDYEKELMDYIEYLYN